MRILKLSVLGSVLLAGCASSELNEPSFSVSTSASHLSEDDEMEITIKYNGKGKPVAEINGEAVLP